jgi:hypothetical protein
VGTIANIKHVPIESLKRNSGNPGEIWFMLIGRGDTPETNQASKMALEWGEEWCRLNSIAPTMTYGRKKGD